MSADDAANISPYAAGWNHPHNTGRQLCHLWALAYARGLLGIEYGDLTSEADGLRL